MTAAKKKEPAHALLSASSAHRWLVCTRSARLEETLPDNATVDAAAGTLAHEIAELRVRKYTEVMTNRAFTDRLKKLSQKEHYDPEMLVHTEKYLDYIKNICMKFNSTPAVMVERRVDYGHIAPEGFGTSDCILIHGSTLMVIDFKYGKGVPVSAENNPQMMLYALGALAYYGIIYDIRTIVLSIVQPRLDTISEWELPVEDLLAWGESIKSIAQKAFAGEGETVAGDHCRFCRAGAVCRGRKDLNMALEQYGKKLPEFLDNTEIADILSKVDNLVKWVNDVKEYALSAVLQGQEIPGWKAVEGTSRRAFTDQEAAFAKLKEHGIAEEILYERSPITLAATEKVLGKPKFVELLSDYVIKPQGKPTLVPENDKREPFMKTSVMEDLNQIEKGAI